MLVARLARLEVDDLDLLPGVLNAVEDPEERKVGMGDLHLGERTLLLKQRLQIGGRLRRALGSLSHDVAVGLVLLAEHAHGAIRQRLAARTQTEGRVGSGVRRQTLLPLGDGGAEALKEGRVGQSRLERRGAERRVAWRLPHAVTAAHPVCTTAGCVIFGKRMRGRR